MSRPKQIPDDEILAAGARLMSELGPAGFTFQSLADRVGVSPATLVQRFGTKETMIASVAKHAAKDFMQVFLDLSVTVEDPVERLIAFSDVFTGLMGTPETFANSLAFFQLDLTNPELNALTREGYGDFHRVLQTTINEAIDRNMLHPASSPELATLVHAVYQGSLMNWAIYQSGSAREYMRANITLFLKQYSI